jgi:hypothetical protein
MNTAEQEQGKQLPHASTDPKSEPLIPVLIPQVDAQDDDPDVIFIKAVAEIDTQPLPRREVTLRWQDVLQGVFCFCFIVGSMAGIVWQVITYPKTLVILYAVEKPAYLITTLDVPTRTLAPITLTRSLTISTTGQGHQDARAATGLLTFYNGNVNPQTVAIGTAFTGRDGIQVSTDQSVTIPAADPPSFGQATLTATTIRAGSRGNIHAYDLNGAISSSLFVKNLQAFTGGRDARTYKAVGQQDIQNLTSTVQKTLDQAFTSAFTLRPGEQAQSTNCYTTTTANHKGGDEAQTVTLNGSETCSAIAYNQSQLQAVATQAFTAQTKPGTRYTLVGSLQSTVASVTPLTVHLTGSWVYVISQEYEQYLAENIVGDTPQQATAYLLKTGAIAQASVPNTLPQAMYITFLVL